jgi:uncharacterized protein YacL
MSRNPVRASKGPEEPAPIVDISSRKASSFAATKDGNQGTIWDRIVIRAIFIVACVAAGFHFHPFRMNQWEAAFAALGFACLAFLLEARLRRTSLRRLIGAAVGSILGILSAYLMDLVLAHTTMPEAERSFLGVVLLLVVTYMGIMIGANKGEMLNLQAFGGVFGSERGQRTMVKVLDTSVIIDGRVADICETHFLDGTLLIPNFVLRELQMVADSSDPLKRQRGRRGLEVLQRIQKMTHLDVEVISDDFVHIPEVDLKLIELAKRYDCKIVTNDFNLNKVAAVHGIEILNVNQLANALKPVVLPGEAMRVFILREGKEYNQGVAYLDDGTMVVVDGARRLINKTVDITVTSVHQTTAGKMIFGRLDERSEQVRAAAPPPPPVEPPHQEPPVRPVDVGERGGPRPILPETAVE